MNYGIKNNIIKRKNNRKRSNNNNYNHINIMII